MSLRWVEARGSIQSLDLAVALSLVWAKNVAWSGGDLILQSARQGVKHKEADLR